MENFPLYTFFIGKTGKKENGRSVEEKRGAGNANTKTGVGGAGFCVFATKEEKEEE
ncbi:MAG: hypothetical protein ACOY32_10600 [Thermodesulfobacteriota bacterium]